MRILAFDIETRPASAYIWRTGQQFVGLEQIIEPPRMLCFAARWVGEKRCSFYSEWDMTHEEMVAQAHALLDEADAVLHYNGKRFDTPWLFTEIKKAGLLPPSPFHQIDLYQQTKKFYLVSHKLQHVSTHLLDLEGKVQHSGFDLWRRVMAGDEKARRLFRRYNIQDVNLLIDAFEELKPWLSLPFHAGVVDGRPEACVTPTCGGATFQRRGYAFTKQGKYARFQCMGCGKWTRGTKRLDVGDYTEVAA